MDKTAQERSWQSRVRDVSNITGRVLEELNIEFATVMSSLRQTDVDIREDAAELKLAAPQSIRLVSSRNYLEAAINMSAVHERCRMIAAKMEKFNSSVDLRHYEFLLEQLPDDKKEQLFKYDPSKKIELDNKEAADYSNILVKQAASIRGFTDWWKTLRGPQDFVSQPNIAMRALESRFKVSFLKQLKNASIDMSRKTYQLYKYLLFTFKKLGWAIATRKIDKWIKISKEFISKFAVYHTSFISYYEKNVKPLKEQQEIINAAKEAKAKADAERAGMAQEFRNRAPNYTGNSDMSMPAGPVASHPSQQASLPVQDEKNKVLDQLSGDEDNMPINLVTPKQRPAPQEPALVTEVQRQQMNLRDRPASPALVTEVQRQQMNLRDHTASSFIATLEKLASEGQTKQLITAILDHSAELEDVDAEKSMQLLSIAEGMLEDKTAGILDFWKNKGEEDAKGDEQSLPLHNSLR